MHEMNIIGKTWHRIQYIITVGKTQRDKRVKLWKF